MNWLLWRQHRAQAALSGGLLAVLGVLLWITGAAMAHEFNTAMAQCATGCQGLSLFRGDGAIVDLVNLTLAVPVLVGVFWGATSVGREYDTGTNLLAWTQSVTRRRWLWAKVAVVLLSSALLGAALTGMVTAWSATENAYRGNRFDPLQFDLQGLMPVAYTVFAAALGLAAGVAWRRVLPAIGTTIAGYFAVRLSIEVWVRPHYLTPLSTTSPLGSSVRQGGTWTLSSELLHNGAVVTGPVMVPAQCAGTITRTSAAQCLSQLGYRMRDTYQPAGRYWTFQWIEAAIFLALTVALVVVAVVLARRRDA